MFDLATTRRAGGLWRILQPEKVTAGSEPAAPEAACPMPHGRFRELRGMVFDMGDVLYDATLWRRWLYQLLVRMGLHGQYRLLYQVWESDFLRDVYLGRRDFAAAFHAFLLSIGLSRGQVDEVEAASQARKRELELDVRPLPGVRATIQRLTERGLRLAVLNNSDQTSEQLQAHLDQLGLGGCFSPVLSSIDLRQIKPSPVCYRAALERMRLPCEAVAFVGHDRAELLGARAIGMRTVAFNHDAGVRADHYLTRFEDLLQLVESMAAAVTTAA